MSQNGSIQDLKQYVNALEAVLRLPSTTLELGLSHRYDWPQPTEKMMSERLAAFATLQQLRASDVRFQGFRVMPVSAAIKQLDEYTLRGKTCAEFVSIRAVLNDVREENCYTLVLWNETGVIE